MKFTEWPEVARIFDEVASLDPAERERVLQDTTPAIRRRVVALLDANDRAESSGFLELTQQDEDDDELPLPDRIGAYRVTGLLGRGGMGVVFAGHDDSLNRPVAIKILTDPFTSDALRRQQLKREANLLAAVQHQYIATLYSLEEDEGTQFITMERIFGEALDARLARGGLAIVDALEMLREIATALEVVHGEGVLHRDLKPANVFIGDDGHVKVFDFGIGCSIEATDTTLTWTGAMNGTFGYMSPEHLEGKPVDPRTDIWSFGCLAFEVLSGVRAFPADRFATAIAGTLRDPPEWGLLPKGTPRPVRSLLRACLEKDPERRPERASSVVATLEGTIADLVTSESARRRKCRPPGAKLQILARWNRAPRLPLLISRAFIALLILVLIGLGGRELAIRQAEPDHAGTELWVSAPFLGRLWTRSFDSEVNVDTTAPEEFGDTVLGGLSGDDVDGGTVTAYARRSGEIRWTVTPDMAEVARVYEGAADSKGVFSATGAFSVRSLHFGDIDGDGVRELLVIYTHNSWYPAIVMAVSAQGRRISSYYLAGHPYDTRVVDMDHDGRDEVLVAGTNNAHGGATIVLLDNEHWSGASHDSIGLRLSELPDGSLARVVLPPIDESIRRMIAPGGRDWLENLRVNQRAEGTSVITATYYVDQDASLVINFDAHLAPTRVSLTDTWYAMIQDWESPMRELAGDYTYLDSWIGSARLYGAFHDGSQ